MVVTKYLVPGASELREIKCAVLGSDFFLYPTLVNRYPAIPAPGAQNAGFLQNIANFNKLVLQAPMELGKKIGYR